MNRDRIRSSDGITSVPKEIIYEQTSVPPPPPPSGNDNSRPRSLLRVFTVAAAAAALGAAVILAACEPPAPLVTGDPPTKVDPPKVRLTFKDPAVRRSKMLVSTNRNSDGTYKPQTYTNTLLNNGTRVTAGASYSITGKPAGLTGQITVNEATGEVTFGEAALDKVNADGPQTVTIQAAYQGGTASYAFTVTDHFSPRALHTSVALGGDLYVIGGVTQKFVAASPTLGTPGKTEISSNEVWRSSDGGLTWDQVAGSTRFTDRANHGSVVLDGALYVIAGRETDATTGLDDVWRSTDRGVSWSRVTPTGASVPFPMDYGFASAVLGTTMYVMGGIQRPPFTRLDEVWQSTDRGVTWTQATNATDPKFPARSQNAAVVLRNAGAAKLYVIGGYDSSSNDLDDVWAPEYAACWFMTVQAMISMTFGSQATVHPGHR